MFRNLKTKVLAVLLILVTILCSMGATKETPRKIGQTFVIDNGITYYVKAVEYSSKTKVTIKSNKNFVYSEMIIDKLNKTIDNAKYDYKGIDLFGTVQYGKISEKTIDYSGYDKIKENSMSLQAIKYKSKTYESWPLGNDYWYCRGTDSTKTYVKIGCIASYRIRTDNLSSNKFNMVEAYISAILSCNTAMNSAIAADVLGVLGCVAGIVVLGGPLAVVITACVFVTGCATALVYKAVDAYGYYCLVKDKYKAIKAYGTKL